MISFRHVFSFSMLGLLLAAGAPQPTTPVLPTITFSTPSAMSPAGKGEGGLITASAEVVPVRSVRLSFPFVGRVAEVLVEEGEQVSTGQVLATLETALLEARLAQAQADLASAETQVRYLQRVGTGQEHLDAAQADVDRAWAIVESAQATLAQATLLAPFNGTIISVDTASGETVLPGQIVIVLADLTQMYIETTDLSERDVTAVREGMPATFYVEALGNAFRGRVVHIADQGTPLGGDVVFTVRITPEEPIAGLRWGMSADVTIHTDE